MKEEVEWFDELVKSRKIGVHYARNLRSLENLRHNQLSRDALLGTNRLIVSLGPLDVKEQKSKWRRNWLGWTNPKKDVIVLEPPSMSLSPTPPPA